MNILLKSVILATGLLSASAVFAVDDASLQQELQSMIDQTAMAKTEVVATVEEGGAVMLNGQIGDQGELESLITKIKEVAGVTKVSSNVTTKN